MGGGGRQRGRQGGREAKGELKGGRELNLCPMNSQGDLMPSIHCNWMGIDGISGGRHFQLI